MSEARERPTTQKIFPKTEHLANAVIVPGWFSTGHRAQQWGELLSQHGYLSRIVHLPHHRDADGRYVMDLDEHARYISKTIEELDDKPLLACGMSGGLTAILYANGPRQPNAIFGISPIPGPEGLSATIVEKSSDGSCTIDFSKVNPYSRKIRINTDEAEQSLKKFDFDQCVRKYGSRCDFIIGSTDELVAPDTINNVIQSTTRASGQILLVQDGHALSNSQGTVHSRLVLRAQEVLRHAHRL